MTEEGKRSRTTCFTVGGALAVLAGIAFHRGKLHASEVTGSVSLTLLAIGSLSPPLSILFHRGWMKLAEGLGYINSRIVLGLFFVLVMTPIGLLIKLLGRDPLVRRGPPEESYWIPREQTRQTPEAFHRIF